MALPQERAPLTSDPILPLPDWLLPWHETLARALPDPPLLASLQTPQPAQGQLARAARLALLASLSLVLGGGLRVINLAGPLLCQGAASPPERPACHCRSCARVLGPPAASTTGERPCWCVSPSTTAAGQKALQAGELALRDPAMLGALTGSAAGAAGSAGG